MCIAKQQFIIDDLKDRIKELAENERLDNQKSYDNGDITKNSAKIFEISTWNNLLAFANTEFKHLENLKITQKIDRKIVALGTIVVIFFISASLSKFFIYGHVYIGFLTSSPIYKAMAGRSKGEAFAYKGWDYKIKDLL